MEEYNIRWEEFKKNPETYWTKVAEPIHWYKKWAQVYDASDSRYIKWFVGGEMNLCYDCLDKKVYEEKLGEKTCLIFESIFTKEKKQFTFREVLEIVSKLAGVLHSYGVTQGDTVIINMPMIPETLMAMMATVRLGASFYNIMQAYTVSILKQRIEEFKPKVIFSTNRSFYEENTKYMKSFLDEALAVSNHQPFKCIIMQRNCDEPAILTANRDVTWNEAMTANVQSHECVPVESNEPLLYIFTSGSTGTPKGIVHTHISFAAGLFQDGVRVWQCYDGEVYFGNSQYNWISANYVIAFGPMLTGTTMIMYESSLGNPDMDDIYRILSEYGVTNTLQTLPALRSFRVKDPLGTVAKKYGPYKLKTVVSGGLPADQATAEYVTKHLGRFIGAYGQTELGLVCTVDFSDGKTAESMPFLSCGKPHVGWDVRILREDGTEAPTGGNGRVVIKHPVGPGHMKTILNNEDRMQEMYYRAFPGYFDTKDYGKFDENGYLYIKDRCDGVFKVGGERFSCGGVEEVINSHKDIGDCQVVLDNTEGNDIATVLPAVFYILKHGVNRPNKDINAELIQLVHNTLSPYLRVSKFYSVKCFPINENGKVQKKTIQKLLSGRRHTIQDILPNADSRAKHIWEVLQDRNNTS